MTADTAFIGCTGSRYRSKSGRGRARITRGRCETRHGHRADYMGDEGAKIAPLASWTLGGGYEGRCLARVSLTVGLT